MLIIYGPTTPTLFSVSNKIISTGYNNVISINIIRSRSSSHLTCRATRSRSSFLLATAGLLAAAALMMGSSAAGALMESDDETLANIPQTLSGECALPQDCKKARIQRPKSRKAESCTIKCVTTCIRGGEGSPGEGPFNVRRPIVVFKKGFRSRQYCLVECSDICNLIGDGDDGP